MADKITRTAPGTWQFNFAECAGYDAMSSAFIIRPKDAPLDYIAVLDVKDYVNCRDYAVMQSQNPEAEANAAFIVLADKHLPPDNTCPWEQIAGEMEEALRPFTHNDLCVPLGGNILGGGSILWQRNEAILRLGDFIKARDLLSRLQSLRKEKADG